MSELAATQIPKPSDEQAFERANEVLWRCELNDPHVKTYAIRGQTQYGVDLTGFRDGDPNQVVGVQAKLKGHGKQLTESEVRSEVRKALTFKPLLREYVIVTTADDSNDLDSLALQLSQEVSEGREVPLRIQIYGWSSLERAIRRHPQALRAFDPSHTPHGDQLASQVADVDASITDFRSATEVGQKQIIGGLDRLASIAITAGSDQRIISAIDREIDQYAEIIKTDPKTALNLLVKLSSRIERETSGRIKFRIAANIAACHLNLDDKTAAAEGFLEAFEYDPENPKAVAKKALGMLLKRDLSNLRKFGTDSIEKFPGNEELAEYLILGCMNDDTVIDPLRLIPTQLIHTLSVTRGLIRWQIDRSLPEKWWATARDAYERFPDDEVIAEYHANALTDEVLRKVHSRPDRAVNDSEVAMLHQAIAIYRQLWNKILDMASPPREDLVATAMNLAQAMDVACCRQDCEELFDQAFLSFPNSVRLKEFAVQFYLNSGLYDRGDALLEELPPTSATVTWRHGRALEVADWPLVLKLIENHAELLPEEDREVIIASGEIAAIQLLPESERFEAITRLETNFSDPRSFIVLAQCARLNGATERAKTWLHESTALIERLASAANRSQRITVAQEAIYQGEPSIAAKLLWGYVDLSRDSDELELLGRAVVFERPVRARAREFFDSLPTGIRDLSYFQFLEGHFYLNSGFPKKAIPILEKASKALKTFGALMGLVIAHLRNNDREAVLALTEDVNYDEFSGAAAARLDFCQVLHEFGQPRRALGLAYEALTTAHKNPEVIKKFCAIVLMPQSNDDSSSSMQVEPGVWVSMTSSYGQKIEGTIDGKESFPWARSLGSNSPIIVACAGLRAGDCFAFQPSNGRSENWTIDSLKPNWLQAFHYLAETYSYLFPADSSFTKINVQEGNLEPILEMVRAHSLANKAIADQYDLNVLPIALLAGNRDSGSIGFAEYLVQLGKSIRTCQGTLIEREEALNVIENHGRAGAVLDMLTAWRAAEMNVLPELKAILGDLVLPSSEFDPLKSWVTSQENHPDTERLSLAYMNGQFLKEEVSISEHRHSVEIWKGRVDSLERSCKIESVAIPNELPEYVEGLISSKSGHVFAPALHAQNGMLLLSDDMVMRQFAATFGAASIWIQAALLYAQEQRILSAQKYTQSVICLIAHRHEYVSVRSSDLLFSFDQYKDKELSQLKLLCQAVGGTNAEKHSHVKLVAAFLNRIWWTTPPLENRHYKAADVALTALLATSRGSGALSWAEALRRRLDTGPGQYLTDWLKGHFLEC